MKKGFTLVEILIVISIIGLLSIFLVPKMFGVRDRAKETAVKGVMHSVQLAIEAYQMENDVYPVAKNLPLESLCRNYLMAGGYIADVQGSYRSVFMVMAFVALSGAVVLFLATPPKPPVRREATP